MPEDDKKIDDVSLPAQEIPPEPVKGYKVQKDGSVLRVHDGAIIPPEPANRDYMIYQQQQTSKEI